MVRLWGPEDNPRNHFHVPRKRASVCSVVKKSPSIPAAKKMLFFRTPPCALRHNVIRFAQSHGEEGLENAFRMRVQPRRETKKTCVLSH